MLQHLLNPTLYFDLLYTLYSRQWGSCIGWSRCPGCFQLWWSCPAEACGQARGARKNIGWKRLLFFCAARSSSQYNTPLLFCNSLFIFTQSSVKTVTLDPCNMINADQGNSHKKPAKGCLGTWPLPTSLNILVILEGHFTSIASL